MQERCKLTKLHKFVLWEAEEWTAKPWSLWQMGVAGWTVPISQGWRVDRITKPSQAVSQKSCRWSCWNHQQVLGTSWRGCQTPTFSRMGIPLLIAWVWLRGDSNRIFFLTGGSSMQIWKWELINTHLGIAFIIHFDFYVRVLCFFLRKVMKQILC